MKRPTELSNLCPNLQIDVMARSLKPFTWQNGFKEPLANAPWETDDKHVNERLQKSNYDVPPSKEQLTSTVHNSLGLNVMRTWPTLYDGTNAPHGVHSWWKPSSEVDVLICGGMTRDRSL